ncbi:hypothetical protein HK096_003878 [Nowakowskiella sp. JEL0078]|nr:hypothetical protein HK096_003878 [Nowakowskiella sp. JEL0078]
MASGFGTNGGRGRCFPFWQEFAKCYAGVDNPKECKNQYEDYQECLYHRKELARLAIVEQQWLKNKTEEKGQAKTEIKDSLTSALR